ncbi:hypothetical protein P4J09_30095 [Bacillus cereus]|nr:hypothetical protein [Bacillus cereus]
MKTKVELVELGEMLKMNRYVFLSGDAAMFNIDSPYIYNKQRMRDLLNVLQLNYCKGDKVYNSTILEVW